MVTRDPTPQVLSALRNNFPAGTSFSVLAVTPDGKIAIHTSDILKPYAEKWYNEDVLRDARMAVESLPARKRSHTSITSQTFKTSSKKVLATSTSINSQTISTLEEDEAHGIASVTGEHASSSPSLVARPRKKSKPSISSQDLSTDPILSTKKSRSRKPSIQGVRDIKTEVDTPEGLKMEPDSYAHDIAQDGEAELNENNEEDDDSEGDAVTHEPLRIGDEEAVNKYIYNKFLQIQQLDCKTIAKCWIKVIEPKKQAHSPYNGGDSTKPWWWPDNAPHKEPDHLLKEDRLDVLLTIVRNGIVPICQLRASTDDAPLRAAKKEILAEMYDVVELELRLKEGTLDRDHIRYVKPFIKGNKRRKKKAKTTEKANPPPPPPSKEKSKLDMVKIETPVFASLGGSGSVKTEYDEDQDIIDTPDGILVGSRLALDRMPLIGNGIAHAHDSQESYGRRQSTNGVIGAAPGEAPMIGSQNQANRDPYVQHTSGPFGRDYFGPVNSANAPFINPSVGSSPGMTDVPMQPVEYTPSPTTLSPFTGHQSPVNIVNCTPIPTTQTDRSSSVYQYSTVGTGAGFDVPVPEPLFQSPAVVFHPTYSAGADFYCEFALRGAQSAQSYPPFYPELPAMQDIMMADSVNGWHAS